MDISMYNKAEVLAALFNGARHGQSLAALAAAAQPEKMTLQEANELLQKGHYFDYVRGRSMKINLGGDGKKFKTMLYNRDNGIHAAECIISALEKADG